MMKKIIKKIEEQEKRIKTKPKESKGQITNEDILRASEYPIDNLIEVNSRGYALCPFHDDHNPSFYIKNNWGYCFSCQESADPIKLLMKLHGYNFIEAVKYLLNK